jgi:hypothetical protein
MATPVVFPPVGEMGQGPAEGKRNEINGLQTETAGSFLPAAGVARCRKRALDHAARIVATKV